MRKYGINFEEDVALNQLDLANEAEVMSSMLRHYSDLLAEAKATKDNVSFRLDVAEAEADLKYRKEGTGLPKDTEASIKAAVECDPKVVALGRDLVEAKEEVYALEAKVDALKNKSDMIKVLKDLFISGYFSAQN